MPEYQHKPDSGTLFDNDRKSKETQPDLTGSALIDGQDYWISGWINDAPNKKRQIKLSFKLKDEARNAPVDETKNQPTKSLRPTVQPSLPVQSEPDPDCPF